MNNILDHFATAFFDLHLKGERTRRAISSSCRTAGTRSYAVDREGKPTPAHNYWKGFKRGTAVGLVLEHLPAGAVTRLDTSPPTTTTIPAQ